jgi:hypothetical protein
MILLDTNVISELMRAEPSPAVLAWFGAHDAADLFISVVTEAEHDGGDLTRSCVGGFRSHPSRRDPPRASPHPGP